MPIILELVVILIALWSLVGTVVFLENVDKLADFIEMKVSSKFKAGLCWTLFVFACGPLAIFIFLCGLIVATVCMCIVFPLCEAFGKHVIENLKTWLTK